LESGGDGYIFEKTAIGINIQEEKVNDVRAGDGDKYSNWKKNRLFSHLYISNVVWIGIITYNGQCSYTNLAQGI
jgi:hypothetical protein